MYGASLVHDTDHEKQKKRHEYLYLLQQDKQAKPVYRERILLNKPKLTKETHDDCLKIGGDERYASIERRKNSQLIMNSNKEVANKRIIRYTDKEKSQRIFEESASLMENLGGNSIQPNSRNGGRKGNLAVAQDSNNIFGDYSDVSLRDRRNSLQMKQHKQERYRDLLDGQRENTKRLKEANDQGEVYSFSIGNTLSEAQKRDNKLAQQREYRTLLDQQKRDKRNTNYA